MTTPDACAWTASANVSWIHITSGGSGTGSKTIYYSVDANPDLTSRFGTITVGGKTHSISQDGISCSYSISLARKSFSAQSEDYSFELHTMDACPWTASVSAGGDWIRLTSGTSGNGSKTISYSIDTNPAYTSREGKITVAG